MASNTANTRPPSPVWLVLSLLWLAGGYTAALFVCGIPWTAAWWQGLACVAAAPFCLFAAVFFVAAPKRLYRRLPRPAIKALRMAGAGAQVIAPWLLWSALVRLMNRIAWPQALATGGWIAGFSFACGAVLLYLSRPRAKDVRLVEIEVPIPDLPHVFDGYRILHLSDLHATHAATAAQKLEKARGLEADLIAFTGDLTEELELLEAGARALGSLEARDGRFAVPGNHDHWLGAARVREALSSAGYQTLVNEHVVITRDDCQLYLAGVDDSSYLEEDDLDAALQGIVDDGVVVLLSHAPDVVRKPLFRRAALILAGHTHGGQISLPGYGPLYVPSRLGRTYAAGPYQLGNTLLFVSRGLGEVFPSMRINCPREIALITLRRKPTGPP